MDLITPNHFQLFKNGHRWNILDKITITELIYSVFSGKDPGNFKSLKIGKEKKSKINRNGNKQASIWPKWISGCMNAQKQAPSGTFRKQYEYAWLEWLVHAMFLICKKKMTFYFLQIIGIKTQKIVSIIWLVQVV